MGAEEDIGIVLKRWRAKTPKRRQSDVADALKVNRSLPALWETNKRIPTADQLQRLIEYYKPEPTEEAALRVAVERKRKVQPSEREVRQDVALDEVTYAYALTKDSKVGGRLRHNQAAKRAIAQYAIDRFVVSPNGVLIGQNFYIADGSTGYYLMRVMIERNPRVMVRTNSVLVASQYAWSNPLEMKLEIAGGEVDREYGGVFGPRAVEIVGQWAKEADTNFLPVTGVSQDGIEAGSELARNIKKAVMACLEPENQEDSDEIRERKVVVLADWTKLANSVGKPKGNFGTGGRSSEIVEVASWEKTFNHPGFFIITTLPPAGTSQIEVAKYQEKAESLKTLLRDRFIAVAVRST